MIRDSTRQVLQSMLTGETLHYLSGVYVVGETADNDWLSPATVHRLVSIGLIQVLGTDETRNTFYGLTELGRVEANR